MDINEFIKKAPKVELHDHLDGGLRPQTVIDLGKKYEVDLPSTDPSELSEWFERGCKLKSLSLYLETFSVTTAVMQTAEGLRRVAYEAVLDWHNENIVYGEIRFAPVLHTRLGLSMNQVVEAVLEGMEEGKKETGVHYGVIICAMRSESPNLSLEAAKLAVAYRDRGVVGFDLAGDESGNPPKKHTDAFQFIRNRNFNITIHAGEAFGLESIWQAVQICGAHRIGHGTRLVDDMSIEGSVVESIGDLARYILDRRIPLEMCISSNIGTGAADSFETHPFGLLFKNNFRVSLCTDNRLMSNTNLTKEITLAAHAFDLTCDDVEKISKNAIKSAFIYREEKLDIIYNIIKPQCKALMEEF